MKVYEYLFLLCMFFICGFIIGLISDSNAMIKVASGEWACELVEQSDKTTDWECKEAVK